MGAGLKHDAQRIGAAEPAAERLRLGGKPRLLDDLTGCVKNAHLDVAVAEIETRGHVRSLAGGSITHGSASFFGPAEPGSSWGPNGSRGRLAFSFHRHTCCWAGRGEFMRDKRFIAVHRGGPLPMAGHQLLAGWAADCAEHTCLLYTSPSADDRPRAAVDAARAWARGEITVG